MSTAYDRLREWVAKQRKENHAELGLQFVADVEILLNEVNAREHGGGDFQVLYRRMTDATFSAAQAEDEARLLREQIETMGQPQDRPLWRRIAGQRREIRSLYALSNMYRRMWRREVDKHAGS